MSTFDLFLWALMAFAVLVIVAIVGGLCWLCYCAATKLYQHLEAIVGYAETPQSVQAVLSFLSIAIVTLGCFVLGLGAVVYGAIWALSRATSSGSGGSYGGYSSRSRDTDGWGGDEGYTRESREFGASSGTRGGDFHPAFNSSHPSVHSDNPAFSSSHPAFSSDHPALREPDKHPAF